MKLEWIEAETNRNQWAQECGCKDFEQAMKIGLVKVGKRHPAYLATLGQQPPPEIQQLEPAKEITDREIASGQS